MRNYKKYLAAAMAATMVVGSSVVANAAVSSSDYVSSSDVTLTDSNASSGTIGGSGSMAGHVEKDVFNVVVPACMTGADAGFNGFDFVLDPEMLISKTDAAKYISDSNAGVTGFEEDKTLYFLHKTSGTIGDTSDFVKVTNKSSMDVDIKLIPKITGLTAITLSDTATFTDDSTSMYMAVTDGTTSTAIKADGSNPVTDTIEGKLDAYDMIVNASGKYEFTLKDDVDPASFDTFEFALTGACNADADWANVSENPNVQITWDIKPTPKDAAPSIANTTIPYAHADVQIPVNLGVGSKKAAGIASVSFITPTGTTNVVKTENYSFTNNVLTLKNDILSSLTADRTFKVTFDDTANTAIDVTVKITP